MRDRFQVIVPEVGLLESFSNFSEANDYAVRRVNEFPGIEVFDRMARFGAIELYRYSVQHKAMLGSRCRHRTANLAG